MIFDFKKITLALALLLIFPPASAADGQMWPLYVHVESGGKPVTGLDASNFRVFLDGRGQYFELERPDSPACVVLLVEHSQQSWPYWDNVRNAVGGFIEYAPQGHWYALMTFDRNTNVVVDFTKHTGRIAAAFSALPQPAAYEIATYDAISTTVDTMSDLRCRRVIVFVGSGSDTFSTSSFGHVEKRLEAVDVVVYSLGTGYTLRNPGWHDFGAEIDRLQNRSFLGMMADKSGGYAWFPEVDAVFRAAMKRIMLDLETQYKLAVKGAIPADNRLHKVKVEAFTIADDKRKNFKVRVREGFRLR